MAVRTLKGFSRVPDLDDNREHYIARFGELSTFSETFSRDKRSYSNKMTYPYPTLVAFAYEDEYGIQFSTNPSEDWQNYVLGILQWITARHVAGQIPTNANRAQFWAAMTSEFTDPVWRDMGTISNMPNTAKYMPEWISFDLDDGGYVINARIWLSDPVFQSEYDKWSTAVIPPADPIDLVNQEFSIVQPLVRQRDNITTINNLINNAKKNELNPNILDPETKVATVQLLWVDPTDNLTTMLHTFTLVHWGAMGLQYENQKAAIRDYLEANSSLTTWPKIYPELYSETDFVVVPSWDKIAVLPAGSDIGLFSSSVPIGDLQANMIEFAPSGFSNTQNYTAFVTTNCSATSTLFRGMQCAVMGSPNNKDQKFKLTQVFPDYMHASTEQADFSRMKPETQDFVRKLNQAIGIAYTANSNNTIPDGFVKQVRNNRLFITFVAGGFQWLVLSRMSFNA